MGLNIPFLEQLTKTIIGQPREFVLVNKDDLYDLVKALENSRCFISSHKDHKGSVIHRGYNFIPSPLVPRNKVEFTDKIQRR